MSATYGTGLSEIDLSLLLFNLLSRIRLSTHGFVETTI